ncbi:MAG TPA: DJ-1/PfpI family protein [Baekduia sp.]|nr:DJ-1/PfpI family protein [Baekduia sp.]
MLIDIVVYDGLDELDALGPLEVLRNAAYYGADITVRLVTREAQATVEGAHAVRFAPDAVYEPGADVLIVPGGGWNSRAANGARAEVQRGDWLPLLQTARQTARILAGVCTGTMLLAHAGVIGARRATTHRGAVEDLAALGATVVSERVVDDGDLITCGGVTSGIDLALRLVEREVSPDMAKRVAAGIEYPPPS